MPLPRKSSGSARSATRSAPSAPSRSARQPEDRRKIAGRLHYVIACPPAEGDDGHGDQYRHQENCSKGRRAPHCLLNARATYNVTKKSLKSRNRISVKRTADVVVSVAHRTLPAADSGQLSPKRC